MNALYAPVPDWANQQADAEGLSTTQWVRLVSSALRLVAGDDDHAMAAYVIAAADGEHLLLWPSHEFFSTDAASLDQQASRSLGGFLYAGPEISKDLADHPLLKRVPLNGWIAGRALPILGDPSRGSLVTLGRGQNPPTQKVIQRLRAATMLLSRALAGHAASEASERARISSRRDLEQLLSRELRRAERGKSILGVSAFRLMSGGAPAAMADYELLGLQEGVAAALRRGGDFVGQYDRSTFITLTTDGDSDSALGAAMKLRALLEELLAELNKDRAELIQLRALSTQVSGEHRELPGREIISRLVAELAGGEGPAFRLVAAEQLFAQTALRSPAPEPA
ncbi:MAG: hypothetical protein Q8Q73_06940 [Stagnimonas sp.]|nr:hypothetical protein [Stagnimonas sp.]